MLLLQKYLDYRIKMGDCSLEWNPLNFEKGRVSSAEQSVDSGTPKDSSEDAMQLDKTDAVPSEQSGSTKENDDVDEAAMKIDLPENAKEATEETMFFCEILPGMKIIILKELCDWQLASDGPIHDFYTVIHTRKMNDDYVFGLDAAGNRILHFGGNGMLLLLNIKIMLDFINMTRTRSPYQFSRLLSQNCRPTSPRSRILS
jgi:hypothetical protein